MILQNCEGAVAALHSHPHEQVGYVVKGILLDVFTPQREDFLS